jgi:hypothetical protein
MANFQSHLHEIVKKTRLESESGSQTFSEPGAREIK